LSDQYGLKGPDLEGVLKKTLVRKVRKRQVLLAQGEVCSHYWFVSHGLFRTFFDDAKGKEHNLSFHAEGSWMSDIGSFHSEKPSRLYIEALEPGEVVQLSKPDLLHAYVHYPRFDRRFRVTIEDQFVHQQERMLGLLSSTANERYREFLKDYSGIAQRLPNLHIASYIGVTPEFLSKLRAKKS
jgi:CRP-like cAMP-binding protein